MERLAISSGPLSVVMRRDIHSLSKPPPTQLQVSRFPAIYLFRPRRLFSKVAIQLRRKIDRAKERTLDRTGKDLLIRPIMPRRMDLTGTPKLHGDFVPGCSLPGWLRMRPGWRSQPTAIAAFLVLGCLFRIIRYAQNLPLWSDECFLSVNFIDRGYRELLEPLDNGQIAPPLFLWIQRFVIDLGGFSEWTLRLFPLFCGLASVFLFWHLARRVLGDHPIAVLLALGIFAVSVHPIRHASEAKPYASDLMVALWLLTLAAEWLCRPGEVRWLWALGAVVPFCLALSNPAVFVAGGIGLCLAYPVWKQGSRRSALAFGSYGITLVGSFALLYLLVTQHQGAGAIEGLRRYWSTSFPPLRNPPRLLGWLISAHTGSVFAYPGGGSRGGSSATTIAMVIGAVTLARRRQRAILTCLLAPFALAFLAAALQRYPYGSEARLMQFAAPSICLLSGLGAAVLLVRVRSWSFRRKLLWAGLIGLVSCAIAPQVVSSRLPYRMLYDHQTREFARRFWVQQSEGAELVCFDLDESNNTRGAWMGRKAWYLCNQMIYAPHRKLGRHGRKREITTSRPLRCVVFEEPPDSTSFREWWARMEKDLVLNGTKVYDVPVTLGEGHGTTERWQVFEFVPRSDRASVRIAVEQTGSPIRR